MDVYRLLSRSTSLSKRQQKQKSSPESASSPSGHRLSAADTKFGDEDTLQRGNGGSSSSAAGNKRKRDNPAPLVLDTAQIVDPQTRGKRNQNLAENESKTYKPGGNNEIDPSDVVECKRILRAHKLKVTCLWSPDHRQEQAAKNGKTRNSAASKIEQPSTQESKKTRKKNAEVVPVPLLNLSELTTRYGVSKVLAANLQEQGFSKPTEVQMAALPLLLEPNPRTVESQQTQLDESILKQNLESAPPSGIGIDLMTVAPTGSGKTLAYLIPVVNAILRTNKLAQSRGEVISREPEAIILAPTKELASQIINEVRKLVKNTGIKAALVRKGMRIGSTETDESSADEDAASLEDGDESDSEQATPPSRVPLTKAQLLVSTPLQLLHSISPVPDTPTPLPSVRHLILDEADVLLDPLFRPQTLAIHAACPSPALRTSLWSATIASSIEALALATLPTRSHPAPFHRLVVGLKDAALPHTTHTPLYCGTERGKLTALRNLLHAPRAAALPALPPPLLVFTQTVPRASALAAELAYDLPPDRVGALHAALSPAARAALLARFRAGSLWLLATTDLLARGVDFAGLRAVVNYDVPTSAAAYVHRAGRTGRGGREGGTVVTLVADEDVGTLRGVMNVIGAAGGEVEGWLRGLPRVGKGERRRLRWRGVESRRAGGSGERISTKVGGGAARRRKKGRAVEEEEEEFAGFGEEEFDGFGE